MEKDDEDQTLLEVADRLRSRFPTVPNETLRVVVGESYHVFDGAPIRTFVGILVEKEARSRLALTA